MHNPLIEIYLNETRVQAQKFDKDSFTIGRSRKNDIVIDDLAISREHAKLSKAGDEILLEDQSSENGCFLNGLRIRRAAIQPEDEILIARYRLKLCPASASAEPVAASAAPAPEIRQEMGTIFTPPKLSTPDGKAVLVLRTTPGGEKIFTWDKPEMLIGRGSNCEISLFEAQVARRHARLLREDDRYIVEDLGSTNGTQVNGKRISTHGLAPGDVIGIGTHEIVFRIETAGATTVEAAAQAASESPLQADTALHAVAKPAENQAARARKRAASTNPEDATLRAVQSEPATAPSASAPPRLPLHEFESDGTAAVESPPPLRPELVETQIKLRPQSPPPIPTATTSATTHLAANPITSPAVGRTPLDTPTIPDELRVTPLDAILKASLEPPKAVSSLFDSEVTLVGVDSQGTIKTPVSPRTTSIQPPPLPKRPPTEERDTGSTQPLRPELVATQVKLRPQASPAPELALEVKLDLDALDPEVREALRKLCESGIELPARLRLRSK